MKKVQVIAICGGSGSGKTTVAHAFRNFLGQENAVVIEQDWYYRDLSALTEWERKKINFDHPDALEIHLLIEQLLQLKEGRFIEAPQYDFSHHLRKIERVEIKPHPLIIVEGMLIFHFPFLRKLFDLKIYIDAAEELRFQRKLKRDEKERGRTLEFVTTQFAQQVKPMHDQFVEPLKNFADQILFGHESVEDLVTLLTKHWTSVDSHWNE